MKPLKLKFLNAEAIAKIKGGRRTGERNNDIECIEWPNPKK